MTIHDDGFADGGEAYTDEEMEIIEKEEIKESIGVVLNVIDKAGDLLDSIEGLTVTDWNNFELAIERLQAYMLE